MRLFIGLPLNSTAFEELTKVTARCKPIVDGFRWTTPEAWHITLQFLGNTSPEQLKCLGATPRAGKKPGGAVPWGGLSFFDRASALVAEVIRSPELVALQIRVVQATIPCGFVSEERLYHPHITLARSKSKPAAQARRSLGAFLQSAPPLSHFSAGELRLYESFLGAGGPRYEVRERFLLGAPSERSTR